MRAREPDEVGTVERDGVRVGYEVFEGPDGSTTVVLLTSWAIVHMRQWKAQVPFLAREFRVITVEGRGNGAADRPTDESAYRDEEAVGDVLAVLRATGTARAVAVGLSRGARRALRLAAWHPDRVLGVVAIGTTLLWTPPPGFDEVRESYEGWQKYNRHYWKADYRGWVEYFMSQVVPEPHSTKQWEDLVGWGLETDPETLIRTVIGAGVVTAADAEAFCRDVRCPVLVVHGDADTVAPYEGGVAIAAWTGGSLVTVPGGGHAPTVRHPVRVNLLIRDFVRSLDEPRRAPSRWVPARSRPRRALFVSSPIGLGHARRDAALARELRVRRPDLEIDWLAQHPVTEVLRQEGARVHPASAALARESAHIESEAGEHDLHAFQAIRRMDEILLANFHVFHDVVDAEHYDLVVADEGWEIDHFLHENPELKRSPYAWLTDFVGWLPIPDGGPAEAALTADYNTEMIEHIARYPWLRDLSVFVGEPEDLVTCPLGPGLPTVRDWTSEHFAFAGWVSTAGPPQDRDRLRAELGWRPDESVCVVTAGGSGVGTALLRRVAAAFPVARERVPGLRMVLVTGPRIDPASVEVPAGVEVRGHVPELERELAACDVAVVQGGLTTTMELAQAGRPFLYFPLAHHFEQQIHVPHRLERLGAGTRMDFATATPESIGTAVADALARPVRWAPIADDGAARAAALLAALID